MSLTVLHACDYNDVNSSGDYFRVDIDNLNLTKIIKRDGSKSKASYPRIFKLGEFLEPSSLEALLPILEHLGKDSKSLVIRHKYSAHTRGAKVPRKAAFVEEVPSNIVAMDIDEIPRPSHISATDLKAQGEYVIKLLHSCHPEMFPDDMGFIAQASSSAGFSDSIKLHMWIRNYDKLSQSQLRNMFYHVNSAYKKTVENKANLVDPALYHTVQAHYTAYPIFENPKMDPFKNNRTFYQYGNSSYVPDSYSPYVKPIQASVSERNRYILNIQGSLEIPEELELKIDRLTNWESSNRGFRIAVIATYHRAMQEQFCLRSLRKILVPIIESIRPGESEDYISQGEISASNNIKACSVRVLPEECKGLKLKSISGGSQEKFLDIDRDLPNDSVTFLKATLGTGKTHTIASWLKAGRLPGKFLALTDTAALVESNAIRFEAGDFRQDTARLDFASGKSNRLSGTLHSLKKIKGMKFDFMFIDEADSLMNNLLFASIIKEEDKAQIIEILGDLLINTDRVVISDGDISEETVACYVDLMQGNRTLNRIDHKRQNLKDVKATQHKKESSLWGALAECIDIGDKCLLVSDSSPKALNEYLVALERRFPEKIIKVVHSSSKRDDDVTDIINNTTKALNNQKIDTLLCSPSITNGVDFNYFDTVFVLTTSENHTPNMRYQAMMREREPKHIHYFFRNMKSYSTGYSGVTLDTGFTTKSRQMMSIRREREYRTYIATFNYYLVEAGAAIQVEDEAYDSPLDTESRDEAKIQRINAILMSAPNLIIPKHNDAFQVKETIKYYYDIEDELSWEDCERYLEEKPDVRAEYLNKVFKQFWYILSLNNAKKLSELLNTKDGYKFYLATGESIAGGLFKANSILRRCGIKENKDLEKSPITNAIAWYKKYCNITPGVELPEELKEHQEQSRDL
tara:strand:- start:1360 stop:4107 length:2748 start_codon:yes stop_codon:yes gene_type:complete